MGAASARRPMFIEFARERDAPSVGEPCTLRPGASRMRTWPSYGGQFSLRLASINIGLLTEAAASTVMPARLHRLDEKLLYTYFC
jgi:hypothetical protein